MARHGARNLAVPVPKKQRLDHSAPAAATKRASVLIRYRPSIERRRMMTAATMTRQPEKAIGRALILLTMCLGVLVAQIDTSVVNLALKHINADLGADVGYLQWVVDAYNLTYATLLLTGGVLGDLYGRRKIFAAGIALFTIGSLICGLAPNVGQRDRIRPSTRFNHNMPSRYNIPH
jgi:Major Facilitator Superfamily